MRHLRSPSKVLNSLQIKTAENGYKFDRLYRNLYNPNFYLIAYQNIYGNDGSMTEGIDGTTLKGMGMERIERIINKLKDFSYQPNPVRRHYIKKANGKLRPLGIPSADDKLVQEVIRLILESIYEPTFSKYSHGFRPQKSCHTALKQIQKTFTGVKWFIEGDIVGCFDNIDHHILVDLLRKKIHDEHFIGLIWKFLRAGYMEQWQYNTTYSGSAQGSIISPILANIYMNELDKFMEDYKNRFDKGVCKRNNPEYVSTHRKWVLHKKALSAKWKSLTIAEQKAEAKLLRAQRQEWLILPSKMVDDTNYRRIIYCRYADDFLVGVIGDKKDAEQAKSDIKEFLSANLKLELSDEKTHITHATDKARFLGYDVTTAKPSCETQTRSNGTVSRRPTGYVKLYVPQEKWQDNLLKKKALRITQDEQGKEIWMPIPRSNLIDKTPVEILNIYNAEIRGLYNYYAIAGNVSVLNKYCYIMEYSMYKTLACKFRCSMVSAKKKYSKGGKFSIPYTNAKGETKHVVFYDKGFCKRRVLRDKSIDIMPPEPSKYMYAIKPKELVVRLLQGKCELCGELDERPKVYQVKKLRDLRPDVEWEEKMISMRRKTLVVCQSCYDKMQS